MEIRGLEGFGEPFSVYFADLPLHEGLEKLVVNYIVVWKMVPQTGQRPVLALVSGPKVFPHQALPNVEEQEQEEESIAADEQSEQIKALRILAKQGDEGALRKALLDPNPTIQATALALLAERDHQEATPLLLDATKSEKPERRLQALQLLYQTDPPDGEAVLSALSQALGDDDSTVKGYAIQALADRGGPNALGYLRQAFNDPDPTIRMLVIEQAALRDYTLPLLQEALSDDDEEVRSLVSSLLSGK
jgi:HEAT repeat protein